jgi:hypothetical protein
MKANTYEPDEWPDLVDPPTPEELADEAAYYAALDADLALADAVWHLQHPDWGKQEETDDMGMEGPTLGRFGNW